MLIPLARDGLGGRLCLGLSSGVGYCWSQSLSEWEAWLGEMGQDISGSWGSTKKGPDQVGPKAHP